MNARYMFSNFRLNNSQVKEGAQLLAAYAKRGPRSDGTAEISSITEWVGRNMSPERFSANAKQDEKNAVVSEATGALLEEATAAKEYAKAKKSGNWLLAAGAAGLVGFAPVGAILVFLGARKHMIRSRILAYLKGAFEQKLGPQPEEQPK